jgi:transcriptional regulator GlxA family with amidase domain
MQSITILTLPGAMAGSVMGTMDVFAQAGLGWNYIFGLNPEPYFDVKIVSMDGKPITCFNGLTIMPHLCAHDIESTDLIIVSSFMDISQILTSAKEPVAWLKKHYRNGTTIASICVGSFLLAETGLLDGKSATTHWGYVREFQKRYPRVRLKPEQIITDEGNLLCSGAWNSYLDLSLYLVERYCGRKTALECSKTIIHDLDRRSQAPYSVYRFNHDHNDSQILAAQKLIEKNYSQAIDLSNVASSCAMSRRTFERHFKVAVGITPLLYMQRIRIEAAKSLLENTNHTFEEISFQVGYDNSSFFRKLFTKHTGLGPKEYQKKFQLADSGPANGARREQNISENRI